MPDLQFGRRSSSARPVIPAQAGIKVLPSKLGPRLRGDDSREWMTGSGQRSRTPCQFWFAAFGVVPHARAPDLSEILSGRSR